MIEQYIQDKKSPLMTDILASNAERHQEIKALIEQENSQELEKTLEETPDQLRESANRKAVIAAVAGGLAVMGALGTMRNIHIEATGFVPALQATSAAIMAGFAVHGSISSRALSSQANALEMIQAQNPDYKPKA